MSLPLARIEPLGGGSLGMEGLFHARSLAITSGKGGVGKTNTAANLGLALGQSGQRVVALDANFGLANLDLLLGLDSKGTLEEVLKGGKMLEEILLEGPGSLKILPAGTGLQELTRLDRASELRLVQGLQRVTEDADWLLMDTAAGIHEAVVKLLLAADAVLVVTTPEPASLVDAYAMVKITHLRAPRKPIWLLVNQCTSGLEAGEAVDQMQEACERFLGRRLRLLGAVPSDPALLQAVREQRAVLEAYPESPSARAFRAAAERLMRGEALIREGLDAEWGRLFG
ncbi:MAG: P-loop NTPase [Holophagaceae bacterium]|nr:P-loop NTPase [Holophagaceae bacterium]